MASDSFALDRVRTYAGWVAHSAKNLAHDVGCMSFWAEKITDKRPFLTEMEGQLDEAEKAVEATLKRIKDIRQRYKALPAPEEKKS